MTAQIPFFLFVFFLFPVPFIASSLLTVSFCERLYLKEVQRYSMKLEGDEFEMSVCRGSEEDFCFTLALILSLPRKILSVTQ